MNHELANTSPRSAARLDKTLGIVLLVLVGFSAWFFVSRFWLPISIDTNLKNLAPELSGKAELRAAINWLSSALEQRFVLLIEANDEDKLFDIAAAFSDSLAQVSVITPQSEAEFSRLLPIFAAYPFNFLNAQDRADLQSASAKRQLQNANADLYRMAASARLFPLSQDPFNLLGNYLLDLGESAGGAKFNQDGVIEKTLDGQNYYYLPLVYRIPQGGLSMTVQEELVHRLNTIENRLFTADPGVHFYRSGIVFYAAEAASQSKRDISVISVGSSLGVLILLLVAFPSVRTLFIPIVSIAFGIAFAFAATHSIFASLHILTIVFGASLIGIVIDYAIHYFFHWPSALSLTKRRMLYRALGLSLVTSSIGYGALGFSELMLLQQVAVFSCCGLVAAWLCILVLSPSLIHPQFTANKRPFLVPLQSMAPLVKALHRIPLVVLTSALLAIFAAILLQGLKVNDDPRTLFTPSENLLRQDQKVSQVINDYEPGKYIVIQAQQESVLFEQLTQLQAQTRDFELFSLLQWLPSPERQRENHALQQPIYQSGGSIEDFFAKLGVAKQKQRDIQQAYAQQTGETLSVSTLFQQAQGSLPPLWVKIADRHYAFALIPKGSDLVQLEQAVQPLRNIDYIDTLHNATAALQDQRRAAALMLAAAFILIAAVLLLRYRQLSCLKMLCVPLCSCLIVVICLHSLGIGITLFHSVALFLVLGLGMDYVIFARESDANEPNTMAAIMVSTITSLLSFGLLATSSLSIVSAIGSVVLIGNLCNFFAVLAAFFKSNSIKNDQKNIS